jgi:integrase
MLPKYTTVTPTGVYKYRRRTPQELKQFIAAKEIIISLGKLEFQAITRATELTQVISEATQLTLISSIPSSVIQDLLNKYNLSGIIDGINNTKSVKSLSSITKLYLSQSQVTPLELANRTYFFTTLLPTLLNVLFKDSDPELSTLTFDKIFKVRTLLTKMPNKNHSNYKSLDLTYLIQGIHKGTLVIPKEHLIATDTVNKNIKRLKSILFFATGIGLYSGNIPKSITIQKQETSDRDSRLSLAHQELSKLFSSVTNDNLQYIYKVLYMTGMRRSELYKCKLTDIEGILCFDLRTPKAHLKTKSSYRVIPVHTQLLDKVNQFEDIVNSIKPGLMTKTFTKIVRANLSEPDKKTMYSLRHTFATNLIAKGIQAEVVSELMGHSHNTMTLNRYVKGYPMITLKSAIESL